LIANERGTGFIWVVPLSNIYNSSVNSAEVLSKLDKNVLTNACNADIQSVESEYDIIQYIDSNAQWNKIIKVDPSIVFGFQGDKTGAPIECSVVTGENTKC